MESITFQGSTDKYNGVTVNSETEACEIDFLSSRLTGEFRSAVSLKVGYLASLFGNVIQRLKHKYIIPIIFYSVVTKMEK